MEAALILKDVAPTYLELANPSQLYETSVKLEKIYDKNKELRDYLIKNISLVFLILILIPSIRRCMSISQRLKECLAIKTRYFT